MFKVGDASGKSFAERQAIGYASLARTGVEHATGEGNATKLVSSINEPSLDGVLFESELESEGRAQAPLEEPLLGGVLIPSGGLTLRDVHAHNWTFPFERDGVRWSHQTGVVSGGAGN